MMAKRLARLVCLVALAPYLAVLASGAARNQASLVNQQTNQPAAIAHSYAPFWHVGGSQSTTLILKNRDRQNAVSAKVMLYSRNGAEEASTQLQLPAGSTIHLLLRSLLKESNGDHAGGMALEFSGSMLAPLGKVVITDSRTHGSFDLRMQGGLRFDTENAVHVPFSLPTPQTQATVTLFNSSSGVIEVTPSITVAGEEQPGGKVSLRPHEMSELDFSGMLPKGQAGEGRTGSLTLRYSGAAHALQPALLIQDEHGFALTPDFNAKHDQEALQQTTTLVFPEVSVSGSADPELQDSTKLRAFALVSNGTKTVLTPQIVALFSGHQNYAPTPSSRRESEIVRRIPLPISSLRPLETRLVDLSQFLDSGTIPASVSHFALKFAHPGIPGDLAVVVFGMSTANGKLTKSEMAILSYDVADLTAWDLSEGAGLQPKVENGEFAAAVGRATLIFQTSLGVSSQMLPEMHVGGKSNQVLDLRRAIRAGIPDRNGNITPVGSRFGVLTLQALRGDDTASVAFEPECEIDCRLVASVLPIPSLAAITVPAIHFANTSSTNDCNASTIKSITATVAGTSPLASRSFTSTTAIPSGALSFSDTTFAAPNALVLLKGNPASVSISVDVNPPNTAVAFEVDEDPSDVTNGSMPTISASGTTATLSTDGNGSFEVLAYLDTNGNGHRDPGESGIVLPYIIVKATPGDDRSAAHSANLAAVFNDGAGASTAWTSIQVRAGTNTNGIMGVGVTFDADVTLVGGGSNGQRGLDRVFLGWINNFTGLNYSGTYTSDSAIVRVQASNTSGLTLYAGTPVFKTGDPDPANLPLPMLDTSRPNPVGGVTDTFINSPDDGKGSVANLTVGQKRSITAFDAPAWTYPRNHLSFAARELRSIKHHLSSTSRLAAWTNTTASPDVTTGGNDVGFFNYSVLFDETWNVDAEYTIAPPAGAGNYVLKVETSSLTLRSSPHNPSDPAKDMVVQKPTTLATRARDARN